MFKKICLLFLSVIAVFGCASDPFSNENVEGYLISYYKSRGPGSVFNWDHIIECKNFNVVKHYEIKNEDYYVEFTFESVFRIDAKDIAKKFSLKELDEVFGDRRAEVIFNMEQKDFKAGEVSNKHHLAAVIGKTPEGWKLKELGFPKE